MVASRNMSRPAAPPAPPPNRPRGRRVLQSTVVVLAVTACCLFAGLIAHRFPLYADVTATRSHRLSGKTLASLEKLTGPTELVVTLNSAAIDTRSAERTRDVLDAIDRASDKLSVTGVDVASAAGVSQLDAAWSRIVERHKDQLARQRAAFEAAKAGAAELATQLELAAETLSSVERQVPEGERAGAALKRYLGDAASFCKLGAKDITESVARADELAAGMIGRSPVPALDVAAAALRRPVPTIAAQLAEVSRSIDAAIAAKDDQIPAAMRDLIKPLPRVIGDTRTRIARLEELISGVTNPDGVRGAAAGSSLINVARVLERSSAALVIGPPVAAGSPGRDLAAVDIDALFPARLADEDAAAPRLDLRARTEELIGSAIGSLVNPAPPIMVVLHGENGRMAPEFSRFVTVFERLKLRGIDIVEWPVWLDREMPPLTAINPRGDRPVVYATLYTIPSTPEDAARFVQLTSTVNRLAGEGAAMLISVNPSAMPAIGQTDAMVEFLEPLGLKVDSARPLLHQIGAPATPVVSPESLFSATLVGDHPVAAAIRGLRLRLPWAVPLRTTEAAGTASITPIVSVPDDDRTWAESQWMEFRSVPAAQRAFIRAQDQPKPDSQRDDAAGPWVVAAALERKIAEKPEMQRLVVVGSNGWFLDEVAEAAEVVDNRRVPVSPGNTELLEASLYWLAKQESAIGASPQAAAAPVIPALSEGTVRAVRWGLIAGLPVLVLLAGAVWRVVRG